MISLLVVVTGATMVTLCPTIISKTFTTSALRQSRWWRWIQGEEYKNLYNLVQELVQLTKPRRGFDCTLNYYNKNNFGEPALINVLWNFLQL